MQKLNQVIAVEKGIKNRVNKTVDELYKKVQKPVGFEGFHKVFQPLDDEEEAPTPESRKVLCVASKVLKDIASAMTDLFDIEATKDIANCSAIADVTVDGETILKQVPATYLLFVEKQLTDFNTIVGKIPVLDPSEDWKVDGSSGMYRTEAPVRTLRTKKISKSIVLVPPTVEHPAQCAMVHEDIPHGFYENTKFSGSLAAPAKQALLAKIEKLRVAVKYAREKANSTPAPEQQTGDKLFSWLLS